ncbi:hypothetical protein ACA910_017892 [Epithemia clementina (nom. ined.)]
MQRNLSDHSYQSSFSLVKEITRTTDAAETIGQPAVTAPSATTTTAVDFPTVGPADVAVFWDYENVRIPAWCPATTAAEGIRNKVAKYGRIVEKRLYFDSRQPTEYMAPRSDLDLSGFTLVDCPSRNRKETLDKKLIVDVLCFAWERASNGAKACVVLITSDGDYSYALARLRDIGVFTVIIYRPDIVAKVLIDNANVVMSWDFDVLGGPPQNQEDDEEDQIYIADESVKNTTAFDVVSTDCTSISSSEIYKSVIVADEPTPIPSRLIASREEGGAQESTQTVQTTVRQPDPQTKGKFALLGSVILNAQHRNVQQGISVYSSWANEANVALVFYQKFGEKDKKIYQDIRALATAKGFVEWGRRNLLAPGKPVIKVKDRDFRTDDLSPESYIRLTYAFLAVVSPNLEAKESDWKMVLPKQRGQDGSATSDNGSLQSQAKASHYNSGGKLFVGGLAWNTTEDSLRSYFKQFGPLKSVVVMEGRGFGFVFFHDAKDADTCLQKGGHVVDKQFVDVKPYEK